MGEFNSDFIDDASESINGHTNWAGERRKKMNNNKILQEAKIIKKTILLCLDPRTSQDHSILETVDKYPEAAKYLGINLDAR